MEKEKNNFSSFIQMSEHDFDQSPNGWRSVAKSGKYVEAANLIQEYIRANGDRIDRLEIMHFHRGQLLAFAQGEHIANAIESFNNSFQKDGGELWNAYVSATIGFLEGDIKKVDDAIALIENSAEEDKKSGNLNIVMNFKKALEAGERDYDKVYSQR